MNAKRWMGSINKILNFRTWWIYFGRIILFLTGG